MITLAFDVLRVHKPNLLSEIEPLGAGQLVGVFGIVVELRRLAGLHVDVNEFDGVVLNDVARIGVAAEHHLGRLLLPHK